nr:immunoglobulin light chain junction region [Macaca mulatta]
CVQGSHWPWAF